MPRTNTRPKNRRPREQSSSTKKRSAGSEGLIQEQIQWAAGPGWRDEKKGTLHIAAVTALASTPGQAALRAGTTLELLGKVVPKMKEWSPILVTLPVNASDADKLKSCMKLIRTNHAGGEETAGVGDAEVAAKIVAVGLGEVPVTSSDGNPHTEPVLPAIHTPQRKQDLATVGRDYQVHGHRWTEPPTPKPESGNHGWRTRLRAWIRSTLGV